MEKLRKHIKHINNLSKDLVKNQLLEENKELKNRIIFLEISFIYLTQQIQAQLEQDRLKKEKRDRRKNQKRAPKREPIYQFLIKESEKIDSKSRFRAARLRLALSLLLVTGIRISELLPLKIKQVRVLFVESFIPIDRAKRKAFLTDKTAPNRRLKVYF